MDVFNFFSSAPFVESDGLVQRDDTLSLSAESLLFDDEATTYGNAALFRVEIFFPLRVSKSGSWMVVCCGMTIFNGGTFGPAALNESAPRLLSSISTSLSALVAAGLGLAHGLFRSNVDTFLFAKLEFFAAAQWNLEFLPCDWGRFVADLFASLPAASPSLRFFRLTSSSPSTSISE